VKPQIMPLPLAVQESSGNSLSALGYKTAFLIERSARRAHNVFYIKEIPMFRFPSTRTVPVTASQDSAEAFSQQVHDLVREFTGRLESILTGSSRQVVCQVVPRTASAEQRDYYGVM
jgi:hypothetical protein